MMRHSTFATASLWMSSFFAVGAADASPQLGQLPADEYIDQMDGVALAPELTPVPLSRPEHLGLFDRGTDLVPVLSLAPRQRPRRGGDQLLAILQVRGEPVGLAIERPGQVHAHYWLDEGPEAPPLLERTGALHARGGGESFWLVDPDRLWQSASKDGS